MSPENNTQEPQLRRELKNRHIQLIALGGAVGTGLFLGSAPTIALTGPSIILGYAIGGFIAFLIMRQLGEMVTEEPKAGSFSYFAFKYWGKFPGFLAGWNYWILYVLVGIAELTAGAAYMHHWFPQVDTWIWVTLFFCIITSVNMLTVKAFGEMEFWFAIIKIAAIVLMIVIGAYLLFAHSVEGATIFNIINEPIIGPNVGDPTKGGFFPYGLLGFALALPIIMFSFGGLELVGMTAAEADNPQKVIPKAVNQLVYRILFFYLGTFIVLLSLYHWSYLSTDKSPFVMIFEQIGLKNVAGVLNFVVLTAALSVYNSCVYATSRMLYGLALQKNAPQVFTKVGKRGVPMPALLFTAFLTFLVIPLNYFVPQWSKAFQMAMSVVVAALIINWAMITISHICFKREMMRQNKKTIFPALFYPLSSYLTLLFDAFILVVMCHEKLGMVRAVIAIPVWLGITFIGYIILHINDKKEKV